jgi:hypothetical protein
VESTELHHRLLDAARNYDPAAHTRGLLAPYRDVLLLQRAKFMSYEQIAATLLSHGLKVSPAAVGCFCRRHFTKGEIETTRRQVNSTKAPAAEPGDMPPSAVPSLSRESGKRGPRIARNDY